MNESSREKLDMDLGEFSSSTNHNRSSKMSSNQLNDCSTISFDRRKGLFIPRWLLIVASSLIITAILLLSILLIFFVPCSARINQLSPESSHDSAIIKPPAARLPTSIVPISYSISLQPFIQPDNFTFDGHVAIVIHCRESTSNITLHANDLIIYNETVLVEPWLRDYPTGIPTTTARSQEAGNESLVRSKRDSGSRLNKPISLASFEIQEDNDFYIVHLAENLQPGHNYSLSMRFLGNLNNDLAGFYRSSYNDTNQQSWIATTQFEPTDARRAFPCFDEPAFKSTFDITLIHLTNMTALSNMPVKLEIERGDWRETRFESTVNMSTYLLAFVVGNLENDSFQEANRSFSVWGRPGTRNSRQYALEIGPKILTHYEKFFGIDYPLPKTDMVAVPDFNAGAMENWGIIIYRETTMLFDPESGSLFSKKRVADVVAHELAHQWFGNLVTPKWWDDLWLNEGFATYMEYEGVNSVHPNWRAHDVFVVDEIQVVFELDCLATSHPISVKVSDPDEINEIFDRISYEKGASLIRMMRYTLGDSVFRQGVSSYLKAMAYSNAEQDDLWHYLTLAQNRNSSTAISVKKVMDSWTLQVGFPLVTLTRSYGGNGTVSRGGKLRQERFLLAFNSTVEKKEKWEIPISLTTQSDLNWEPSPRLWMHAEENEKQLEEQFLAKDDEWMIINLQEVGYYKVNYDERNWRMLIAQLKKDHTQIHVLNRAQIIDDLLDLAKADIIDYPLALEATRYLVKEEDFIPWSSASTGLRFLDVMLRRTSLYGQWKSYVLSLIEERYNQVGWIEQKDSDDIANQTMQLRLIYWACYYQYMPCIREAQTQFESWRNAVAQNKSNPIHPNLRSDVVCFAIQWGNEKDWQWVWEQYLAGKSASEKEYLMRGLACSREPWILTRYLEMSLDDSSGIRKQDGSAVFRAVAASEYGRDIAFNYFRNKWDRVVSYYGKSYFAFGNLVRSVSSSIAIQFELEEFKSFHDKVKDDLGTAQRAFKQAIEKAEANVEWMNRNYREIESWLNQENVI